MLGILAGIVLTSTTLWFYWRRQKRRKPRMRDLEEDMKEAEQPRS